MVGHENQFGSKKIDEIVQKGIECDSLEEVLDFFYYHEFLMYYPHPEITSEVFSQLKANDESGESLLYFLRALATRNLIKMTPELHEEVMQLKGSDKPGFLNEQEKVNLYFDLIAERNQD